MDGELISIYNYSDPYPQLEQKTELTRKCLRILAENHCRLQIITKSDMVIRDIDIQKQVPCVFSISILTIDDRLSLKLEPGAPISSRRLKAIETLVNKDVPTTVRIDPIIPLVNDDIDLLVENVANLGAKHITCSTYKVKPDNWTKFSQRFPDVARNLKSLYFIDGERVGSSTRAHICSVRWVKRL